MGLPVVASNVKGHQDLIEDDVTGLLCPYGDVEACTERIRRLVGSGWLRRELARNAREAVEQYGLERVMPLVWEQYTVQVNRDGKIGVGGTK